MTIGVRATHFIESPCKLLLAMTRSRAISVVFAIFELIACLRVLLHARCADRVRGLQIAIRFAGTGFTFQISRFCQDPSVNLRMVNRACRTLNATRLTQRPEVSQCNQKAKAYPAGRRTNHWLIIV